MAGASQVARRFPVRIGRAQECELRLDEEGVWDMHLVLSLDPAGGYSLKTQPNALARVNGHPVSEILLRNGDLIEVGAARIRFWLSPLSQPSLGLREAVSWGAIGAVVLAQIAVLYWLLE